MKLAIEHKIVLAMTAVTAVVIAVLASLAQANAMQVAIAAIVGLLLSTVAGMTIMKSIVKPFLRTHEEVHRNWVADTSHELRTPLAILRAQIEALQDGVQQPNAKTLNVLHKEVMHLSKMVDFLHDLAKSDLGELKYEMVPVDISSVLEDALEAFEERMQSKEISIDAGSITEGPRIIKADADRLKQLFINLLENSYRYTKRGGKIKISLQEQGDNLSVIFDDTEPSVPDEILEKIFERFIRGEGSRSRQTGGTGLGLAICKTIAEGHGGTIAASHSPLGGLQIRITIPLERSAVHV